MRYLLDTNIVSDLVRNPQGKVAQQIRKAGNDCSGWNDQTREINFRYKVCIGDQTTAGLLERVSEKLPGQHRREDQDGIRDAIGRHLGDPAKNDRENDHGEEGPKYRPNHADRGLLVTDRNVSPSQDVE